jgi:hypothetical protein
MKLLIMPRRIRKVIGAKREEVIREWRRLHNEELHNLFSSEYCQDDRTGTAGYEADRKGRYHFEALYVGGRIIV